MRKTILKIISFLHYISYIAITILVMLTIVDILGRFLFNSPIRGKYELSGLLLVVIVFFTFGYSEYKQDNVKIDFLYERYPSFLKKIVDLVSQLIYLVIVATMAWRVIIYGKYMMSTNAVTGSLRIPYWPIILASSIGMIGLFLVVLVDLIYIQKRGGNYIDDNS
ncbi:MAG: TRAP transporter small permease [Atribacterota bacterium]|nr:TRAP transporter small permease [Atribacterota bacterium]